MALFNSAVSAAISLALADVILDPFLVWPWVTVAIVTFLTAFILPSYFRHLNVPLADFADVDRQPGPQQPMAARQIEDVDQSIRG